MYTTTKRYKQREEKKEKKTDEKQKKRANFETFSTVLLYLRN